MPSDLPNASEQNALESAVVSIKSSFKSKIKPPHELKSLSDSKVEDSFEEALEKNDSKYLKLPDAILSPRKQGIISHRYNERTSALSGQSESLSYVINVEHEQDPI